MHLFVVFKAFNRLIDSLFKKIQSLCIKCMHVISTYLFFPILYDILCRLQRSRPTISNLTVIALYSQCIKYPPPVYDTYRQLYIL